jgi:hypothetical protein
MAIMVPNTCDILAIALEGGASDKMKYVIGRQLDQFRLHYGHESHSQGKSTMIEMVSTPAN